MRTKAHAPPGWEGQHQSGSQRDELCRSITHGNELYASGGNLGLPKLETLEAIRANQGEIEAELRKKPKMA